MADQSNKTAAKKPSAARQSATPAKTEQECVATIAEWLNTSPEVLAQPEHKSAYAIVQSLARNLAGGADEQETRREAEQIFSNPSIAYTLGIATNITSKAGEFAEQTGEEYGQITGSIIGSRFQKGFLRGLQNAQHGEVDTFALGKLQRDVMLNQLKDSNSAVGKLPAATETNQPPST